MTYRDDVREFEKESRWTVFKFIPLFLVVILLLATTGFVTKSMGLWGSTFIERKVFEESYQRSSALEAQIASNQAALAEITRKLSNPELSQSTRHNLEAQASAIRIRIATARGQQ